jgi:hypothetical protein
VYLPLTAVGSAVLLVGRDFHQLPAVFAVWIQGTCGHHELWRTTKCKVTLSACVQGVAWGLKILPTSCWSCPTHPQMAVLFHHIKGWCLSQGVACRPLPGGSRYIFNIASIMITTLAVDGRCALLAVPRVDMRSPFQMHHRLCFPSYPHVTNQQVPIS